MVVVGIIFLKKKVYIDLWSIIKNLKFPFWNILFALIATVMGSIAEDFTNNNFIFEEGCKAVINEALSSCDGHTLTFSCYRVFGKAGAAAFHNIRNFNSANLSEIINEREAEISAA